MDLLRAARRAIPHRDHVTPRLAAIDAAVERAPDDPICTWFHDWAIVDYAGVYVRDLSPYPALERRLPRMPTEDVQRHWNGNAGAPLMTGSATSFMKIVTETYERLHGPLREARVLDYGAGWGRLTRMFLQHVPDDRVDAADAMPESVALFDSLGFRSPCRILEAKPSGPIDGAYDLVVLHSVLTHLPLDHTEAVLASLLPATSGLLCVTIRPPEYWDQAGDADRRDEHERAGYAHRAAGEAWGDTSMTAEYLARHAPGWRLIEVDDRMASWMQTVVWLTPTVVEGS
jgi:hypothetical protein